MAPKKVLKRKAVDDGHSSGANEMDNPGRLTVDWSDEELQQEADSQEEKVVFRAAVEGVDYERRVDAANGRNKYGKLVHFCLAPGCKNQKGSKQQVKSLMNKHLRAHAEPFRCEIRKEYIGGNPGGGEGGVAKRPKSAERKEIDAKTQHGTFSTRWDRYKRIRLSSFHDKNALDFFEAHKKLQSGEVEPAGVRPIIIRVMEILQPAFLALWHELHLSGYCSFLCRQILDFKGGDGDVAMRNFRKWLHFSLVATHHHQQESITNTPDKLRPRVLQALLLRENDVNFCLKHFSNKVEDYVESSHIRVNECESAITWLQSRSLHEMKKVVENKGKMFVEEQTVLHFHQWRLSADAHMKKKEHWDRGIKYRLDHKWENNAAAAAEAGEFNLHNANPDIVSDDEEGHTFGSISFEAWNFDQQLVRYKAGDLAAGKFATDTVKPASRRGGKNIDWVNILPTKLEDIELVWYSGWERFLSMPKEKNPDLDVLCPEPFSNRAAKIIVDEHDWRMKQGGSDEAHSHGPSRDSTPVQDKVESSTPVKKRVKKSTSVKSKAKESTPVKDRSKKKKGRGQSSVGVELSTRVSRSRARKTVTFAGNAASPSITQHDGGIPSIKDNKRALLSDENNKVKTVAEARTIALDHAKKVAKAQKPVVVNKIPVDAEPAGGSTLDIAAMTDEQLAEELAELRQAKATLVKFFPEVFEATSAGQDVASRAQSNVVEQNQANSQFAASALSTPHSVVDSHEAKTDLQGEPKAGNTPNDLQSEEAPPPSTVKDVTTGTQESSGLKVPHDNIDLLSPDLFRTEEPGVDDDGKTYWELSQQAMCFDKTPSTVQDHNDTTDSAVTPFFDKTPNIVQGQNNIPTDSTVTPIQHGKSSLGSIGIRAVTPLMATISPIDKLGDLLSTQEGFGVMGDIPVVMPSGNDTRVIYDSQEDNNSKQSLPMQSPLFNTGGAIPGEGDPVDNDVTERLQTEAAYDGGTPPSTQMRTEWRQRDLVMVVFQPQPEQQENKSEAHDESVVPEHDTESIPQPEPAPAWPPRVESRPQSQHWVRYREKTRVYMSCNGSQAVDMQMGIGEIIGWTTTSSGELRFRLLIKTTFKKTEEQTHTLPAKYSDKGRQFTWPRRWCYPIPMGERKGKRPFHNLGSSANTLVLMPWEEE